MTKGYVRLKDPDEEIFLGEGAGTVPVDDGYRVWDRNQTVYFPLLRLVTVRLGTGKRPADYQPVANGEITNDQK